MIKIVNSPNGPLYNDIFIAELTNKKKSSGGLKWNKSKRQYPSWAKDEK